MASRSNEPGCLGYGLWLGAGLWATTVTIGLHSLAWSAEQVARAVGADPPGWLWVALSLGHAAALAIVLVPAALLVRSPALGGAVAAWLAATAYVLALSLARAWPVLAGQAAALTQIAVSAVAVALLAGWGWLGRRANAEGAPARQGSWLALAVLAAPVAAGPMLLWGALGSPLDTALYALAGLGLGLVAGLVLDGFFFRRLAPGQVTFAEGGVAAVSVPVALIIMAGGFGFAGTQLLLLAILGPLGLAAAGLGALARRAGAAAWPAVFALVGLAAAIALALVDPAELNIVLEPGDILTWTIRAAALAFFLSLAVGVALLALALARLNQPATTVDRILAPRERSAAAPAGWLAAGLVWLGALLVYLLAGQPGFYGDRLFVILADQADLSAAAGMADRNERLAYVYETLVAHADTTQAPLRATFDRLGLAHQPYYLVNAIEVQAGGWLRAYLAARPEVDRVLASPRLRPLPEPGPSISADSPAPDDPQWNLTGIGAERVWDELGVRGAGIVVGQSDSGVDGGHPALAGSYRGRAGGDDYNWLDPWNHTASPTDPGGHGTHTLGSVLGQGIGVAPGAEWFGCANLARNLANPALYLDCLQFMLAPYPAGGDPLRDGDPARAAHVLNNSWGCPPLEGCDPESLAPAVRALRAAGIFVVASAGNDGAAGCESLDAPPAIYAQAFSVAAIDRNGDLASFSSRGPVTVLGDSGHLKPDLAAPGVDVLSAVPGGGYAHLSGTSMAGPHVAGVVALMWSANPALIGDIDTTERLLIETAQPYTGLDTGPGLCDDGPAPNYGVGHGVVDAFAAVEAALAAGE